jgi:hypothetical protein
MYTFRVEKKPFLLSIESSPRSKEDGDEHQMTSELLKEAFSAKAMTKTLKIS